MIVKNYMAILRNLRNIIEADVSPEYIDKVCKAISDPESVRRSRQLPFRFLSAYKSLPYSAGSDVFSALESAADASVSNMPKLPGRTVIAVDVSGSMSNAVSSKSTVRCCEISMLLGLLANRICESSLFCTFNDTITWERFPSNVPLLYTAAKQARARGGTDMNLPFLGMRSDNIRADRVIIISDNECNYRSRSVQSIADSCRKATGQNFWVHAIDLMGYGTQQFFGGNTNIIAGWSEKVFDFILLAEKGESDIDRRIASYKW